VNKEEHVYHTLEPFYDKNSRVLILGSFPSPLSRETGFYYGHPRNRFWQVLAQVFQEPIPQNHEEKKALLRKYHIALWDVLEQCDIIGASDSSIKNPVANDIRLILEHAPIEAIFTTGTKAGKLYQKYIFPMTQVQCKILPSTSPANAACSLEHLVEEYRVIQPYCINGGKSYGRNIIGAGARIHRIY